MDRYVLAHQYKPIHKGRTTDGASLDTSALVWGKVVVGVRKLSGRTDAARLNLLRVVGPLVSGFCVDSSGTPRHDLTCSVQWSVPARGDHYASRWYISTTSFLGCVTAKSSAKLDRVALCARQLLLDLNESSIHFVWILPPLEVDLIRKLPSALRSRLMA